MLLSPRKSGLDSLFKEVRVFKLSPLPNLLFRAKQLVVSYVELHGGAQIPQIACHSVASCLWFWLSVKMLCLDQFSSFIFSAVHVLSLQIFDPTCKCCVAFEETLTSVGVGCCTVACPVAIGFLVCHCHSDGRDAPCWCSPWPGVFTPELLSQQQLNWGSNSVAMYRTFPQRTTNLPVPLLPRFSPTFHCYNYSSLLLHRNCLQ